MDKSNELHPDIWYFVAALNMVPQEYAAHFERQVPSTLTMVLMLLGDETAKEWRFEEYEQRLETHLKQYLERCKQAASDDETSVWPLPPAGGIMFAANVSALERDTMSPIEKKWSIHGAYLQVGFITCDPELGGYERALQFGLAVQDRLILTSRGIEPADHFILRVPRGQQELFENCVGDFFKNENGVWRRELMTLRDQWLITARCWITGRDAEAEYQRFIKAGGTYYLQYPALCP